MLHVSVEAVALGTGNGAGTDVTGEDAVLRVIFEVTAVKSGTVAVHGGGVPAGDVHLAAHAADALAVAAGQVGVEGGSDDDLRREANGRNAGKVVFDGSGAVAVDGRVLVNAGLGLGLVAAQGDQIVHLGDGHLVEQGIPTLVVVVSTAQVS